MPRTYSTEAIVLGSHKFGEADRVVMMLTREQGKVPTVVKGVRKLKSRFGGRLEPFTQIQAQLYAGRNLHTLTGADTITTHAALRAEPAMLNAGLAFIDMLNRAIPEFERRPRTFNLVNNYLAVAETVAGTGDRPAVRSLTLGAQLKLLLLAGYLPHLSHCAACGSTGPLERFSAADGGAVCRDCGDGSFTVSLETLEAMRALLENPLADAPAMRLDEGSARELWLCLREICRFHLGFDLKLKPF